MKSISVRSRQIQNRLFMVLGSLSQRVAPQCLTLAFLLFIPHAHAQGENANAANEPAPPEAPQAIADETVETFQLRETLPLKNLILVESSQFEIRNGTLKYEFPSFNQELRIHRKFLNQNTSTFDENANVLVKIDQDEHHTQYVISDEDKIEEKNQSPLHQVELKGIWKDGRWEISLKDDRQPSKEETREIRSHESSLNFSHLAYPEKPVPVGHTWELNKEETLKVMMPSDTTEDVEAKCKYTFEEIIDFNGILCAKLLFEHTFNGKILQEDADPKNPRSWMKHQYTIKGVVFRALDQPRDLFYQLRGHLEQEMFNTSDEGEEGRLVIKGPVIISGGSEIKR